jgi:hypothetical protein
MALGASALAFTYMLDELDTIVTWRRAHSSHHTACVAAVMPSTSRARRWSASRLAGAERERRCESGAVPQLSLGSDLLPRQW